MSLHTEVNLSYLIFHIGNSFPLMHSANQFVTPLHVQLKDFLLYEHTDICHQNYEEKERKFSQQYLNCLSYLRIAFWR